MVDTAKIEAEAKELAAETTSVISSLLGTWNPRWPRFVETWKGWSLRKKGIALVLAAAACGFVSAFGVSTLRLISGSYRSAYAYGHGQNLTKSDISGMAHMSDISDIQRQIDGLKSQLASIDDKIDSAVAHKPAQITTGSIPKKAPAKKASVKSSASSWFSLP